MLRRVGTMVVATALLAACSEPTVPTGPQGVTSIPVTAPQSVIAELSCSVDVAARLMTCGPSGPSLAKGLSADLIIGGQNQYLKLASTNVTPNGTISLTADESVQNLTGQPWATTDGATPTATGVDVFFFSGPTNGVTVTNATGTGFYTAPNQPYFRYSGTDFGSDGILSPNEISSTKNWQFTLGGQASFSFKLLIKTALPSESGVLRWTRTALPTAIAFDGIWGSSATDVWVGGTQGAGSLQHYDGASWSAMTGALPGDDIRSIWGSAPGNVYAVGGSNIEQWNGTTWSDLGGFGNALLYVWGSGATDVYVGGINGTLLHSTGGAFTQVASTGLGTEYVDAIWGSGPGDVYIGGNTVRHWDGAAWSSVSAGITSVRAMWGSSATDVWIAATAGAISHLSGGTWTATTLGTADFAGLWGSSASDVWAVNRTGEIYHYNGTTWTLNSTLTTGNAYLNIWGSGPQDVWVSGTDPGFSTGYVHHGFR